MYSTYVQRETDLVMAHGINKPSSNPKFVCCIHFHRSAFGKDMDQSLLIPVMLNNTVDRLSSLGWNPVCEKFNFEFIPWKIQQEKHLYLSKKTLKLPENKENEYMWNHNCQSIECKNWRKEKEQYGPVICLLIVKTNKNKAKNMDKQRHESMSFPHPGIQ